MAEPHEATKKRLRGLRPQTALLTALLHQLGGWGRDKGNKGRPYPQRGPLQAAEVTGWPSRSLCAQIH